MSPASRPASNEPADVAKWEAEVEAEQQRLAADQSFREAMLQFVTRTDTTLTHIQREQQLHAENDRRQFRAERRARKRLERKVEALGGQVTQSVTTNKHNWGVVLAWASAFVFAAGVGWTLIEKFGGALKP